MNVLLATLTALAFWSVGAVALQSGRSIQPSWQSDYAAFVKAFNGCLKNAPCDPIPEFSGKTVTWVGTFKELRQYPAYDGLPPGVNPRFPQGDNQRVPELNVVAITMEPAFSEVTDPRGIFVGFHKPGGILVCCTAFVEGLTQWKDARPSTDDPISRVF